MDQRAGGHLSPHGGRDRQRQRVDDVWLLSITVNPGEPPPTGLPSGWSATDVGATGATGQSSFSGGTFTVTGAGADVWGTADQFHYAYRTLTGDGTIVARVASIQFVHAWTKAGVMIRNSLSPSAAQAFMLVAASSAKGVPFQRRPADGAASVSTPGSQSTAPRWVKLVRAGNLITGYESADGVTWDDRRQRYVHDGVGGLDWSGGVEPCDRHQCDGDVRQRDGDPGDPAAEPGGRISVTPPGTVLGKKLR